VWLQSTSAKDRSHWGTASIHAIYPFCRGGLEPHAGLWSRTERSVRQHARTRAEGIVESAQADALLREIRQKLTDIHDPKDNSQVITRVDLASEVYQGPYARTGPDALVGYNRSYRAGWKTILGAFPSEILEDNANAWSGDHCMDYTKVPGVLLSNRKD